MKTILKFLFALALLVVGSMSVGYSSPDIDQNGLVYDQPNECEVAPFAYEVNTSLHSESEFMIVQTYHLDDSVLVVCLANEDHAAFADQVEVKPNALDRVLQIYISNKKLHKGKYRNKVPSTHSYGYHPHLKEAPVIHVS